MGRPRPETEAMDSMNLVVAAAIVVGLPGLASAAHLGLLALGSWFYRETRPAGGPEIRFLVLVPAHNEEQVIDSGLEAIMADRRPRDLVWVVADCCTDRTANRVRVRRVGARTGAGPAGRPGGRAAGRGGPRSLARVGRRPDARRGLRNRARVLRGVRTGDGVRRQGGPGAQRKQPRAHDDDRGSLAAFTLQGITIPRGRDRLGISVRLRGTGMAIRRDVALAHRFRAPASEDLFFTLDLLLDGVRCRHVDAARVSSRGASKWGAFGGQKVRYEAGRMAAARAYVPRLLRRAIETSRRGLPGDRVVPGLAAIRGWRAVAPAGLRPGHDRGRLDARRGLRRAGSPAPRPRPPHRPDPGSRRTAHLARPVRRAVVSGVEGRGAAARRGERPAPRRLPRADRSCLTCERTHAGGSLGARPRRAPATWS